MELQELVSLQKQFDSEHSVKFKWDQPITQEDHSILSFLSLCLSGEVGELCNYVKKVVRGDKQLNELMPQIENEIADIFIYLLKLAYQSNIDLEKVVLKKMRHNRNRFKKFKHE